MNGRSNDYSGNPRRWIKGPLNSCLQGYKWILYIGNQTIALPSHLKKKL